MFNSSDARLAFKSSTLIVAVLLIIALSAAIGIGSMTMLVKGISALFAWSSPGIFSALTWKQSFAVGTALYFVWMFFKGVVSPNE